MIVKPVFSQTPLLSYPVIVAASQGDPIAIQSVLRHYRGYINKLATRTLYDEYGNAYIAVDADVRDHLENALIEGIMNFNTAA